MKSFFTITRSCEGESNRPRSFYRGGKEAVGKPFEGRAGSKRFPGNTKKGSNYRMRDSAEKFLAGVKEDEVYTVGRARNRKKLFPNSLTKEFDQTHRVNLVATRVKHIKET